jgi:hypothetical protein
MTPLPVADLHKFWPWMRAGLEQLIAKHSADWIPEDIYTALKTNGASAFEIGERQGFLVARVDIRPCGPVLFVWVAYAPDCLAPLMESVYADLRALAQQHGCDKIMQEGRRGWERRGWKLTSCVYELD